MNNELLLLITKHTDTPIEQRISRPRATHEYTLNKQMETFSFAPRTNVFEEGKWLLAVTSFETTNSVFIITVENNSFSISMPGY